MCRQDKGLHQDYEMRAPDPIDLTGNSSLHVLLETLISEGGKLSIDLSLGQSYWLEERKDLPQHRVFQDT